MKTKLNLILIILFCSLQINAQIKHKVFSSIQKLLNKASGEKIQSNDVFAKKGVYDKLGKQVFTEKEVTVNTLPGGQSKYEWIKRTTEIMWDEFLDYLIYTGFKNSNLQIVELNFKKSLKNEHVTIYEIGDASPNKFYSKFEFYVLTSDKKELEQLLTRLYELKKKKLASPFNKEIEKFNKQQTITRLKENLSNNIVGNDYTTSLKLTSFDECNLVYEYTNFVGRKYQETMPTSIEAIGKYNQLTYSKKSCISKSFAFGLIQDNDEITYKDFSFLSIKSQDEYLISNIEYALKHLANFCNSTSSGQNTFPDKPEVVLLTGGTFIMGRTDMLDAAPHSVTLKSYSVGKYEVTVGQYKKYCTATGHSMPKVPSWGWNEKHPIVNVNYDDAVKYCKWLSETYAEDWQLPTEAQWEFAAKDGTKSQGYFYSGCNNLDEVGCYDSDEPRTGGQKKANELGIYDMSGNVFEWCKDWFGPYTGSIQTNPQGATSGSARAIRGGSFYGHAAYCPIARRNFRHFTELHEIIGFRVVLLN